MMNIMYRHIMYRGKNTSVPTVETCRGASLHYVSGHVVHIACRGLSRQTLRVGVCCVKHCRVVVCRIDICRKQQPKVNFTTLQQHYKKTTINNQEQTRQHPFEAHCSKLTAHYFQYSFRPAIHKRPLYPRHAKLVLLLLCLAR